MLNELLVKNNISLAHLYLLRKAYYINTNSLTSKSIPIIQTLHDYKLICQIIILLMLRKYVNFVTVISSINLFLRNVMTVLFKNLNCSIGIYFSKWNGNISKINHLSLLVTFLKKN